MAPHSYIFFLATLALFFTFVNAVAPIVDVSYSKYKGKDLGNGVTQWLGMRYAAPPVGELRFMPPQDPVRSRQVKDASKFRLKCAGDGVGPRSIDKTQSEDCLFINVFAPTNAARMARLPVFVDIQGGGFTSNSKPTINGTGLIQASGMNMIVVTFNYRVSIFGFLSYGDMVQPNIGLLDQRQALQWVQKYISRFGGDPKHVTLGGNSAGGASVAFHLAAYGGRDDKLFHAAAAESISSSPIITLDQAAYRADSTIARLNCVGTGLEIMACLRNKTAVELSAASTNVPYPGVTNKPISMWAPIVDGDFVRDGLFSSFDQGKFVRVPSLIGATTNEGNMFVSAVASSSQTAAVNFWQAEYPQLNLTTHMDRVKGLYSDARSLKQQLTGSYGDMRFLCAGASISGAMSRWMPGKAWNYWYNVEDPTYTATGLGIGHCMELHAVWGPGMASSGNAPPSYYNGGINYNITTIVQGYWSSFIRSKDPNPYRSVDTAVWGPYSSAPRQRLVFDTAGKTSLQNMTQQVQERCDYFGSIAGLVQQ
ncbi:alpha beta-hydrolase [Fusarium heterosporum]|uniref:Carboxylic ester hydrolase n=1 Tax=Fusarium heterosporum TaxID=42747 RepID=A0A8H5TQN9_FUSHE|nr:alpha beta-hydrolase [Fusarium heterosporum]